MKITKCHFVAGHSAFYFDDQAAIKQGAVHDGFTYRGEPVTEGFQAVRQAGETVSILLELENGRVAMGDCTAVQYSGAGGRDPLFRADRIIPFLEAGLRPLLEGRDIDNFLGNARFFDRLELDGKRLHTAVRYGLSQALLEAAAEAYGCLKTETLCREYGLPVIAEAIPLFGQSGDDRYAAVDKMLLKRVDVLPHGLINNVPGKLGRQGEKLQDYLTWLKQRTGELSLPGYRPEFHIDVYGTVGEIFDHDPDRIAGYLAGLGELAGCHPLSIEGPVDAGGRAAQIEALGAIRARLRALGSNVRIIADEWCNTLEDIIAFADAGCCDMVQIKTPDLGSIHNIIDATLHCREKGVEAYQGGTCNESDISARSCVHVALAARPMRLLVKPGMGFDEGLTIVGNEMNRTITLLKARERQNHAG